MPYQKSTKKILSGSLNLTATLDVTPEPDAIAMSNLRSDSVGSVRTRSGNAAATYTGLGSIKSQHAGIAHRYTAGGTALFRDGSSVVTSLDGNPVGLASFKALEWIMNRASNKQLYDTGAAIQKWGIAAPSGAPAVAVGTELKTTVETFESAVSWTTVDPGIVLSDDAVDFKAGTNSLKVVADAAGHFSFSKAVTLNLNSVGGQTGSDDDKHRLWLKFDPERGIKSITLTFALEASPTFDTDYYEIKIDKKHLRHITGWILLEFRRASSINDILSISPSEATLIADIIRRRDINIDTVESVGDLPSTARAKIAENSLFCQRFGTTAGRDWSTVTGLKVEVNVIADGGATLHMDGWEVFGSLLGAIEGRDIRYAYIYTNASGHLSNPGPFSDPITFNRRRASVSSIADSPDGQVTGKYLVRTGGTLGAVYLVNTTPIANGVTTYDDTNPDSVINQHDRLQEDNDLPPACTGLIGPFLGRLIAYSSASYPNRYWWSKLNMPFAWPGAALTASGQWNDLGDSGTAIVAATHHGSLLIFYKTDSVWRVIGDPEDQGGVAERADVPFGTPGRNCVCRTSGPDAMLGPDGIYLTDGQTARKISQKLDPLFKGRTITLASGVTKLPLTSVAADRAKAAIGFYNSVLWFSYAESGSSVNSATLKYDFTTEDWVEDTRAFNVFYDESGVFFGGQEGGSLIQLDTGTADNASGIPIIYQSGYSDFGVPDTLKTVEDIVVEADTGGATLTLTVYKDNGTAVTLSPNPATFSTTAGTRTKFTFQFESTGKGQQVYNISARITGTSNTSNPVVIYGLFVHWYPEARTASSYDTQPSLLGSPGVKEARGFRLDIDNPNSASLVLSTDLPGGEMTARGSAITIASATGRRVITKILADRYRGYLMRGVLDSTAMKVYGMYAEVRDIGDYVVAGELWDSDELNFGSQKAKGMRSVRVELDAPSDVTLKVYSDIGGGVLVLRETKTITGSASGRHVVEVPLTTEERGFLFRLSLTSAADWALYGVECEVKEYGTYVIAGKVWNSDPVDFGSSKVKRVRSIKIEIENSAAVDFTFKSDLPGSLLATRDTFTVALGARRVVNVPLDAEYDGYVFQLSGTSSADFIILSLEFEMVEVGTYISGSEGKIWDSGKQGFGTERIKLIKEIELVLVSSATVSLALWTDQPGNVLASRVIKTMATTGGIRQNQKILLEDGYKGREMQIKLSTVSTDFQLEAARLWLKTIGAPNATGWQWLDLPVVATQQGVWGFAGAPVEPTSRGIWGYVALPVVKSGSNEWRWQQWGPDAIA